MIATIGVTLLAGISGKIVSPQSAAAKVVGWITVAVVAVALFFTAKALYDATVVDEHERDQRAEINESLIVGERSASAKQRGRDTEFAKSQADIQEGMNNARKSDPDSAAQPVSGVLESYFDGLRDDQNRKTR